MRIIKFEDLIRRRQIPLVDQGDACKRLIIGECLMFEIRISAVTYDQPMRPFASAQNKFRGPFRRQHRSWGGVLLKKWSRSRSKLRGILPVFDDSLIVRGIPGRDSLLFLVRHQFAWAAGPYWLLNCHQNR